MATWKVINRKLQPNDSQVSAIGLTVSYEGRETSISIALPRPVAANTPDDALVTPELQALRTALDHILGAASR